MMRASTITGTESWTASAAYTYALDGISGLLQKYPSIEVVLDVHRDGVSDGTRLVTEIDGTETREDHVLQRDIHEPGRPPSSIFRIKSQGKPGVQLPDAASGCWKISRTYAKDLFKGLRYNEHVRARSALIGVEAQTNTYAEAKSGDDAVIRSPGSGTDRRITEHGKRLHIDLFLPFSGHIVELYENRSYDPAHWISESDNCGCIADRGRDIEVDLAEQDKGEQHDQHWCPGISGSAHRTRNDLVRAAECQHEHVHRRNMVPYRTASGSWLKTATSRGAREERIPALADVMRSASQTPHRFLFRAGQISCSRVLTHKGRGCLSDTLHRKKETNWSIFE